MTEKEKIMEEEMSNINTTVLLPQDILMDILSRFPVETLLDSFKLVCKPWRTLIQDPDFIKMHLSRGGGRGGAINGDGEGRISSNNHSLICKYGKDFFQLHLPFNSEGIPPTESAKKLDFDLSALSISRLVGSCNGLLCLSANDDKNIILLNPYTRRYKISPIQPIQCPKEFTKEPAKYGFGCCYNPTTNIDEYKVVRIVYFVHRYDHGYDHSGYAYRGYSKRSQVDVYCMSSNSWRKTDTKTTRDDYAFHISDKQSGVFVNEAVHWVAASLGGDRWDTISSFDIRDEEFRQVPVPLPCEPYDEDEPYFKMHKVIFKNMKGCLSMIRPSPGRKNVMEAEAEAADIEIWVMKEYGIKESWTKEFVIRSWDTDTPWALSNIVISSWISSANVLKGDHILMERLLLTKKGFLSSVKTFRKLVLYDRDFKLIGFSNEPYPCTDRVDYIETLVSLKSSVMVHALESNLSSPSS